MWKRKYCCLVLQDKQVRDSLNLHQNKWTIRYGYGLYDTEEISFLFLFIVIWGSHCTSAAPLTILIQWLRQVGDNT